MVNYAEIQREIIMGKKKAADFIEKPAADSNVDLIDKEVLSKLIEEYAASKRLRIEDVLSPTRDLKGFNYFGRFSYKDFNKKLHSEGSQISKDYYLSLDEPINELDGYINKKMDLVLKAQEMATEAGVRAVETSDVLTYSGQVSVTMCLLFKKSLPWIMGGAFGSYVVMNPEVVKEIATSEESAEVSRDISSEIVVHWVTVIGDNLLS